MTDTTSMPSTSRKETESLRDAVMKRFTDAPWCSKRTVTLGGIGGIGSNLAYNLIKLGLDMNIFEMDTIEAHNIGGQHYTLADVGSQKVVALMNLASGINKDCKIQPYGELTEDSPDEAIMPITFSGFDSIPARRVLFEKWYKLYKDSDEAIFIDGRMSAENFEIFAVKPSQVDAYRDTLFDDVLEDLPCNYKATTQTGLIIAGMMTGIYTNFVTELLEQDGMRSVPFHVTFNIPLMLYEISEGTMPNIQ